ncbi:MAG: c-type cytochrome [Acidiferrobacter sp.]
MVKAVHKAVSAGVGLVLLIGSAYAAAPVKVSAAASIKVPAAAAPMKAPAMVTTVCSACHGLTGVSMVPMFPSLAGQGAPYLVKQIRDFQNHKRADPLAKSMMWAMAATIPKNKIQEIADYFASQKGAPGAPEGAKLVAAGHALYMGGVAADHLPACMACHGSTGRGLPPLFPRLAGQHMTYVVAQLQAFKTKQRANDPLAIMRTIAGKLTNQQMSALAAYIRTL